MATNNSSTKSKLKVLRELNNTLQLHAERMKLMDRGKVTSTPLKSRIDSSTEYARDHDLDDIKPTSVIGTASASPSHHPSRIPVLDIQPQTKAVSPARKRRLARDVVKSYRPGYTWNRGGRLKELRIRYIARKYATIWKSKVYGRVLPSTARNHYAKKIKRQVFDALHEEWWKNRREWRLQVRAACHDRYRLWNKAWKKWKQYTQEQRRKRLLLDKAITFQENTLLIKAMLSWQLHTVSQSEKSALRRKAEQHFKTAMLRGKLNVWRTRLASRRAMQSEEIFAQHAHHHTITRKFWSIWINKLRLCKEYRETTLNADIHCQTALKRKSLKAMINHTELRKLKHEKYAEAERVRRNNLLHHYLTLWRARLQITIEVQKKEDTIQSMSFHSTVRRYFSHWRHYMNLKQQKYERWELACQHSTHRILSNCLTALRLVAAQRRVKDLHRQQAEEFSNASLMKRTWRRWLERCDQCEELRLFHLTKKAQCHHRVRLMSVIFTRWKYYISLRHDERVQETRCDVHYAATLMSKCFKRWADNIELTKWKRDANEQATALYRTNMEAKYLYIWQSAYDKSMEIRTMDRLAMIHYQDKLGKRFLSFWRLRTEAVLDDYENMTLAADHHRLKLLVSSIKEWKQFVANSIKDDDQYGHAVLHRERYLKKSVLISWKMLVKHRKDKMRKLLEAEHHANCKLLRPVLAAWLSRAAEMRRRKLEGNARHTILMNDMLRDCVDHWRREARRLAIERRKIEAFQEEKRNKNLIKVLRDWRECTAAKVQTRLDDEVKIGKLQDKMGKALLRATFGRWRGARDEAVLSRLKFGQACIHSDRKQLTGALRTWKQATVTSLREKELDEQAELACQHRLRVKFFLRWRNSLLLARIEMRKTQTALYQWSLALERKCLIAWFYHTAKRKAKKALYQQAMMDYRQSLLADGVRQWIVVADTVSQMRECLAADRHAQHAHWTALSVQKCFDHWRAQTRKNRKSLTSVSVAPDLPLASALRVEGLRSVEMPRWGCEAVSSKSPVKQRPAPRLLEDILVEPVLFVALHPASGKKTKEPERKRRPPPKQPSYLMESLEREGLWKVYEQEATGSVMPAFTGSHDDMASHQERVESPVAEQLTGCSTDNTSVNLPLFSNELSAPAATIDELSAAATIDESSTPAVTALLKPSDFHNRCNQEPASAHRVSNKATGQLVGLPLCSGSAGDGGLMPPSVFTANQKDVSSPAVLQCDERSRHSSADSVTNVCERLSHDVDHLSEIEHIKASLLEYKSERRRLKSLSEQLSVLYSCVGSLTGEERREVDDEMMKMTAEISLLTEDLKERKKTCHAMACRIKLLSIILAE